MRDISFENQVGDSVPKVRNEIAVGEDLEFQRKWWRFEKIVWPMLLAIVVVDLLGGFGRGWLSKATRTSPDHAMQLDYERVVRAGTPSIMTFKFEQNAIHDGRIVLFVSDSVVKPLGAQRVSPQPAVSSIGHEGITYVFPASQAPASVQIELQPSFPGWHRFTVHLEGSPPITATTVVMP